MTAPQLAAYHDVLDALVTAAAGMLNAGHQDAKVMAGLKAELVADPALTRDKAIALLALAATRMAAVAGGA